jgi:hypothetical protein
MGNALDEDIRAAIEEAIASQGVLRIPELSKQLAAKHPGAGLDANGIAELLLKAGVEARVPLEWGSSGGDGSGPGKER